MIFEDTSLKSIYELDHVLQEEHDLLSVSKEIYRITQLLMDKYQRNEIVKFYHYDNNGDAIYVDFNLVSENTWYRSVAEIKQILYRHTDSSQFSIHKALYDLGIIEPESTFEYNRYLQLLYLMYIINYFAFPNLNIFKKLHQDQFNNTYDEGTTNGKYVSFIMNNLFEDEDTFIRFQQETINITDISNDLAIQCRLLSKTFPFSNHPLNILQEIIESNQIWTSQHYLKDPIFSFMEYCKSFSMRSYCVDLYNNLSDDLNLFKFDSLTIQPSGFWKQQYIPIEKLDDFLMEDELYSFCYQKEKHPEVREKIKFVKGKSVAFLKKLIAYDHNWKQYNDDFILIETINNTECIYALKAAIVIKTYYELTTKLKTRINESYPLRSLLSVNFDKFDLFPATLPIRYFLLACHAQYLNAIMEEDTWYPQFKIEYLIPELLFLKLMSEAYNCRQYENLYIFLAFSRTQLSEYLEY